MRDSLGSSRGINRHRYSIEEAEQELQRPVVQALLELCRFRNSHPAFNGEVHPLPHAACALNLTVRSIETVALCSNGETITARQLVPDPGEQRLGLDKN